MLHPRVRDGLKDEGAGTMFGSLEEAFTEELFRPFVFGLHEVGSRGIGRNIWVLCLKRRVKAVNGDFDMV